MKGYLRLILVVLVSFLAAPSVFAQEENVSSATPSESELVVADFNTGDKPSNIGGDFGAWDKDPNDETQGCQQSFEAIDALGDETGYAIRLDYDVDSPNPAYNGFWMKLNDLDATAYNTVNFYLKGDATNGFTKRVKVELKDSSKQPSPYIVAGVTDQWQKFSIPFEKFRRVKNWDVLNEFVVVFDDRRELLRLPDAARVLPGFAHEHEAVLRPGNRPFDQQQVMLGVQPHDPEILDRDLGGAHVARQVVSPKDAPRGRRGPDGARPPVRHRSMGLGPALPAPALHPALESFPD